MRILLTGATGFLGSSIIRRVTGDERFQVTAVVRHPVSFDDRIAMYQVEEIDDETAWGDALHSCHAVIHAAARVHVMNDAASDPVVEYRRVNVEGTLNLARQAAQAGVRRFVFISTVKVNGEHTEAGNAFVPELGIEPEDPYALSKYQAELGLQDIAQNTGMEVVIIRPPLVYGPGVKANFAALMKMAASHLPLPLGGFTENRRSMVYVENLVDLIITCIDHPGAANNVFMVSDGEDLSTAGLISRLRKAMERPRRLFTLPSGFFEKLLRLLGKSRVYDRLNGSLQVDITKTRQKLDWRPPYSVDEGVQRTVNAFLANRS